MMRPMHGERTGSHADDQIVQWVAATCAKQDLAGVTVYDLTA